MSPGPVFSVRAQQTAQIPLSTISGLDEDATKWGIYEENGNPISAVSNATNPSLDGRSVRCAILGGNPYSNVHCYRNLPAESNSNIFLMDLSFYYKPDSTFNNANGVPSIVQGLEFTMNKWQNGLRYEWALQWDNVDPGAGAPKWRYWDPASADWFDAGISGGITGGGWHTLVLEGGIFNGQVHYRRFIFDGTPISLDRVVDPALEAGEPNKLAVAVQLDGNYQEDSYELFLDDVTLITGQSFNDVPFRYWAFDWIQRLYTANITSGCSANPLYYCPNSSVTRDQMAVFLLKGEHGSSYVPPAVGASTGFNDIPINYWAAAWIKQLAAEGITAGCGGGNFCPGTAVTRDQMAVFLLKAKHGTSYVPPVATGVFTDVLTNYWAATWIEQLAAEGITGGCNSNPLQYCPSAPVTRDQMAVFLVKNFNLP